MEIRDLLVINIRNIKIYDSSLFHMEDVLEKYNEYIKKLLELDPIKLRYFLLNLKNREIIKNQETELEESFMLELYKLSQKSDSIDMTMSQIKDHDLSKDDIKKIHRMVIKGSSDDIDSNYNLRSDNNKWVGSFGTNGESIIDYRPPDYNEIEELLDIVLDYLNDKNDLFDNLFIKPLIVHALIAYIQPFGNGNTRLSRVLQHCKICNTTNKLYGTEFSRPTFYLSENYLKTRSTYRGLIKDISVDKSDDAWNKWFKYNLNMIDEQLFFLNNQLIQYKKLR